MGWFRIEHAVSGYVELVRRRERGDRELLNGPGDRKARAEAKKHLVEFHRRANVPLPQGFDPEAE
jgi:hypothetical protein